MAADAAAAMLALFDRAAVLDLAGEPVAEGEAVAFLREVAARLRALGALGRAVVVEQRSGRVVAGIRVGPVGHSLDATPVAAGAGGWGGVGLALAAVSLLSAGGPRRARRREVSTWNRSRP